MGKKIKKTIFFLFGTVLFLVVLGVALNYVAKRKIKTFLQDEFTKNEMAHGKIDVALFRGDLQIDSLHYSTPNLNITLERLNLENFHIWDYFTEDKIIFDRVRLNSPSIKKTQTKKDSAAKKKGAKKPFRQKILVNDLIVKNGVFVLAENKTDTLLYVSNFSSTIDSLAINSKTLSQKIPFVQTGFGFEADIVYYDMGRYYELKLGKASVSDEIIFLQDISLQTKFSRPVFRNKIPYEKDMYDLNIDTLKVHSPWLDFVAEKPTFKSGLMKIIGVDFEIYRDKTVRDDPRFKKMYSTMLRKLDLKLDIEKTRLRDTYIKYEERIKLDRPPGRVAFYDLSADIQNLTNINLDAENFPKTKLDISTSFMNTTNLKVEWQFDVSNKRDYFTISGQAGKIPSEAMNPFFVPAMHVKAKGNIDAVYFNFAGDYIDATGDMKMEYSNFSVVVLKKNGEEKNKFLSFIANIFVNSSPKDGVVTKKDIPVKRDRKKSFWNYFWSCIERGLLKSVI